MKKRIVALLLVLVLSMAMVVPVFAAGINPCANGHVGWGHIRRDITGYSTINGTHHYVYYKDYGICGGCGISAYYNSGSYTEGHWPPCSKCGCGLG